MGSAGQGHNNLGQVNVRLRLPTIANSAMVRQTEFNDTYASTIGAAHPSEVIPGALAVGEEMEATGREVLTSIILGYELTARVMNAKHFKPLGWHHTTNGLIVVPMVIGKLLGLDEDQLVNALGFSCSYGLTVDKIQEGHVSMMRNMAYPLAAQTGIMAALLARRGFTGPEDVFEGDNAGLVLRGSAVGRPPIVRSSRSLPQNQRWSEAHPGLVPLGL